MPFPRTLLPLILLAVPAPVANADESERTLFTDAFTDKLADGWTWVREDAEGWRLDQGTLIVRTSTGGLWQKENDGSNILLRTPPEVQDGKLAVEVLVDIEPTNVFENAGLMWYYDDDNYVIMVKERIGQDIHMQLDCGERRQTRRRFSQDVQQGKVCLGQNGSGDGEGYGELSRFVPRRLGDGWPMQPTGARRTEGGTHDRLRPERHQAFHTLRQFSYAANQIRGRRPGVLRQR